MRKTNNSLVFGSRRYVTLVRIKCLKEHLGRESVEIVWECKE
jgi:hypothetical protein